MAGSPVVAATIAQLTFWVLLVLGTSTARLTKRAAAVFVLLWLAGYIGLPRIAWWTGPFVTSWVAALAIVLVFMIFKGDVKLT